MNDLIGYLPSRHYILIAGTVIAITVMVLMILIEYRFTWRMVIVSAMSMICTIPGALFGEIARKLNYGQWLDMADFLKNISEYEGTHYIGRAIYTAMTGLILWRLIMRKNEGPFEKNGQERFLGILSIFMGVQIVIGRVGCLKNGCCLGSAYYGPLSVMNPLGYRSYPAVHTELILNLVTFLLVMIMYKKRKNAFSVFCAGYGTAVFTSEFMYDKTGTVSIAGLSALQLLSLILIATGVIYSYLIRQRPAKVNNRSKKGGKA